MAPTATLDRVFSALSDPSRRAMVERLGHGPASVSELGRPLDMTLAAVVQHVQVLDACGVVRTRKRGRVRVCELRPESLERAGAWLVRQQERFWKAGLEAMNESLGGSSGAKET